MVAQHASHRQSHPDSSIGLDYPWHFAPAPLWPHRGLDRLYAFPIETRSSADFARLRHWDLPAMADFWLWREQRRVEWRLAFDGNPERVRWLLGRLDAIAHEWRRRRRAR